MKFILVPCLTMTGPCGWLPGPGPPGDPGPTIRLQVRAEVLLPPTSRPPMSDGWWSPDAMTRTLCRRLTGFCLGSGSGVGGHPGVCTSHSLRHKKKTQQSFIESELPSDCDTYVYNYTYVNKLLACANMWRISNIYCDQRVVVHLLGRLNFQFSIYQFSWL